VQESKVMAEVTHQDFDKEVLRSAMKYQVMSIPLVLFQGGEKVNENLGAVPGNMISPKVAALV